jgi:hypothetical protein
VKGKTLKTFCIILAAVLVAGAAIAGVAVFCFGSSDAETTAQASKPVASASAAPSPSPKPAETPKAAASSGEPAPSDSPASPEETGGTYTIDNARFGIDSTGQNARATTDGINAALEWAKAQGYKTIEFQEGTYQIQCNWGDRFIAPTDGILVPSDLTLDLGNSTFVIEPNSNPEYVIFGIVNQSHVTIKNGTLTGDRDAHTYAPSEKSPTHEYGFGICISASSDVLIENVIISGMTGDGIILEGSYSLLADGGGVSSNVRVLGCSISGCRRQGISVVGATGSEIAQNEIYGIAGTAPQYGIMVMSALDYTIDGLAIHDNNIYDCAGGAISCNNGSNIEVYANTCSGNILAVCASGVSIYNNIIQSSYIEVMTDATDVTVEDNILDGDSWIKIDPNTSDNK